MSKRYEKLEDEEVLSLISKVIKSSRITNLEYEVISDSKLKEPIKFKILSSEVQTAFDCEVLVSVNESIFALLQENSKSLAIDRALANIDYDSEKEVLKNIPPDIVEHGWILEKYTANVVTALKLEIEQILDQLNDKEKE